MRPPFFAFVLASLIAEGIPIFANSEEPSSTSEFGTLAPFSRQDGEGEQLPVRFKSRLRAGALTARDCLAKSTSLSDFRETNTGYLPSALINHFRIFLTSKKKRNWNRPGNT